MIHVPGTGRSRWNADLKKTKNARSVGDPLGMSGSHWKQEDKNRKAEEKAARKAARRRNRS